MHPLAKLLIAFVALGIAIPSTSYLMIHWDGSVPVAVERLAHCAGAVEALGNNPQPSVMGMSCGASQQLDDQSPFAGWTILVRGDKGAGALVFEAKKAKGEWQVIRARLDVNDKSIPVVPCYSSAIPDTAEGQLKACNMGHPGACNTLAIRHASGRGVTQDFKQARKLYGRGCDLGFTLACVNLGFLFEKGAGGPRNKERAIALYELGCNAGKALGCHNLGIMFLAEETEPKNASRAADLFQRACKSDHFPSCNNLGRMYLYGAGVPKELTRGLSVFLDTCDRGHLPACNELGKHYLRTDQKEAGLRYLRRSCSGGNAAGCQQLQQAQGEPQ